MAVSISLFQGHDPLHINVAYISSFKIEMRAACGSVAINIVKRAWYTRACYGGCCLRYSCAAPGQHWLAIMRRRSAALLAYHLQYRRPGNGVHGAISNFHLF